MQLTVFDAVERFAPGTRVRCHYRTNTWPNQPWMNRDHQGTVLADDDPRAWANTLAFPEDEPNRFAVRAHINWCREQFGPNCFENQPVLWDFGKVYWDSKLYAV